MPVMSAGAGVSGASQRGGAGGTQAAPVTTAGAMGSAGAMGGAPAAGGGGASAGPVDPECDLRGVWIEQHVLRNVALGATQLATSWGYHRIEQQGERVRIVQSVDCGMTVRGTADVSLSDATTLAVATRTPHATGVAGTFKRSADGTRCSLAFERSYGMRGADRARFIDPLWKVGDPPKPLSEFPLPRNAADGMEDWEGDGFEGITILTGLGDRYIAQIDYFDIRGDVPARATQFGGDGVLSVDHDARETISAQTPALLQTTGIAMPPGYAFMARVDGEFEIPVDTPPTLQACKRVQALAIEKFGDPPRP